MTVKATPLARNNLASVVGSTNTKTIAPPMLSAVASRPGPSPPMPAETRTGGRKKRKTESLGTTGASTMRAIRVARNGDRREPITRDRLCQHA